MIFGVNVAISLGMFHAQSSSKQKAHYLAKGKKIRTCEAIKHSERRLHGGNKSFKQNTNYTNLSWKKTKKPKTKINSPWSPVWHFDQETVCSRFLIWPPMRFYLVKIFRWSVSLFLIEKIPHTAGRIRQKKLYTSHWTRCKQEWTPVGRCMSVCLQALPKAKVECHE